MPVKKSELYSSLWASCYELRGGMDASQYKDYVLVLLFVKYVSDKAASQKDYLLEVPKGGSFADMVALKGDKEIGDKINTEMNAANPTGRLAQLQIKGKKQINPAGHGRFFRRSVFTGLISQAFADVRHDFPPCHLSSELLETEPM